jgi:hypothetical protein
VSRDVAGKKKLKLKVQARRNTFNRFIKEHRGKWLTHLNIMENNRFPELVLRYKAKRYRGYRDTGRQSKDGNGSKLETGLGIIRVRQQRLLQFLA